MVDTGKPREETVGVYEMLWDCESCGTKGLLGKSQRHCGNCGAAQNPDKRYFPKDGEAVEVKGHQFTGGDIRCGHCDTPNTGLAKNCVNCGAPMTAGVEVKAVEAPKPAPPAPAKGISPLYVIIAILLIGGLVYWRCIRTTASTASVTSHGWTRSIATQIFGEISKSDWKRSVPADAKSIACKPEQSGTKQVPDGETCHDENVDNKDGTFTKVKKCEPKTKDEPVMDDKCTYIVLDWKDDEAIEAKGTGLDAKWPDTKIPEKEVARAVGAKRQVGRSATYTLQLGTQTCVVDEPVWRKYSDGQAVNVQVHANGDISCKDL